MGLCKYCDEKFIEYSDQEFQNKFMHIITQSSKDGTYKFAFARFLLDYTNEKTIVETKVDFKTIAEYFLRYYWPQICNSKLKQGRRDVDQKHDKKSKESNPDHNKPQIVQILNQYFPKPYYHQNFSQIQNEKPQDVKDCIEAIEKECFKNVPSVFQKIKNEGNIAPMFFKYDITGRKKIRADQEYVDMNYGIEINPHAIDFFKRFNVLLKKVVIFEWARFLEPFNSGYPEIIHSIEFENENRDLKTEKKWLRKIEHDCFYCEKSVDKMKDDEVHVEHILPYSYLKHNKMWNLTLACKECNCKKLGTLPKPQKKWIKKISERNKKFRKTIPKLDQHLIEFGDSFEDSMNIKYQNALAQGFIARIMPPRD